MGRIQVLPPFNNVEPPYTVGEELAGLFTRPGGPQFPFGPAIIAIAFLAVGILAIAWGFGHGFPGVR